MRPDFLHALHASGVAMMGSLAALRGLSREELAFVYRRLREESGGFKKAVSGGRVPVKRDLLPWARTAARGKSELLLAEWEDLAKGGRSMQGWPRVDADAVRTKKQLGAWVDRGVGFAGSLPPKS
jgi:hypothetical protein